MDIFSVYNLENEEFLFNIEVDENIPDGILESFLIERTPEKFKDRSLSFKLKSSEKERVFKDFFLEFIDSGIDDII